VKNDGFGKGWKFKIHATYSPGMDFIFGGAVCGIKIKNEPFGTQHEFASPQFWESVTCGRCRRIILGKIKKWEASP
jgi:hypothetical protein